MNARTGLYLMTAVLLAGSLAGCQDNSTIDTGAGAPREVTAPTELVAQARPPVPDLPVPVGCSLDQGNSRSYAAAGFRLVYHTYTGRVDKWAVGRFYKLQMPINRWVLESDRMIRGTIELEFSKDKEKCSVIIDRDGWLTPTRIVISVQPSGKLVAPVDK